MKLEGEALTKATDLFKGLKLDQAQAQSLVDFHTAALQAVAKAPENAFDALHTEWKTASEADPDIGPKAKQIRETLGKAFDTVGDPKLVSDFKHAMNLTGVGDHPAFIKIMSKFAAQVVEGAPVRAGGPAPVKAPGEAPKSIASAMYPNLS